MIRAQTPHAEAIRALRPPRFVALRRSVCGVRMMPSYRPWTKVRPDRRTPPTTGNRARGRRDPGPPRSFPIITDRDRPSILRASRQGLRNRVPAGTRLLRRGSPDPRRPGGARDASAAAPLERSLRGGNRRDRSAAITLSRKRSLAFPSVGGQETSLFYTSRRAARCSLLRQSGQRPRPRRACPGGAKVSKLAGGAPPSLLLLLSAPARLVRVARRFLSSGGLRGRQSFAPPA